jgi:hypothetical protein
MEKLKEGKKQSKDRTFATSSRIEEKEIRKKQ